MSALHGDAVQVALAMAVTSWLHDNLGSQALGSAEMIEALEATGVRLVRATALLDAMKVSVCEYLMKVNADHDGPFIPPTAIDWLGNGIVHAIARLESSAHSASPGVEGMTTRADLGVGGAK